MAITLELENKIDRVTYDRLYSEARSYIQHEVDRNTEEGLKEGVWKNLNSPPYKQAVYLKDDYVVGCAAYISSSIGNLYYLTVMLGADQNGSKSWWYSEDAVKADRQLLDTYDCTSLISAIKPTSPIGTAAGNRFTIIFNGNKYFNSFSLEEIESIPGLKSIKNIVEEDWKALKVNVIN